MTRRGIGCCCVGTLTSSRQLDGTTSAPVPTFTTLLVVGLVWEAGRWRTSLHVTHTSAVGAESVHQNGCSRFDAARPHLAFLHDACSRADGGNSGSRIDLVVVYKCVFLLMSDRCDVWIEMNRMSLECQVPASTWKHARLYPDRLARCY